MQDQQLDDNINTNESQKKQGQPSLKKYRTYTHDIAQLIKENKLSKQDLAKLSPSVIEEAQRINISDDFAVFDILKKLDEAKKDVRAASSIPHFDTSGIDEEEDEDLKGGVFDADNLQAVVSRVYHVEVPHPTAQPKAEKPIKRPPPVPPHVEVKKVAPITPPVPPKPIPPPPKPIVEVKPKPKIETPPPPVTPLEKLQTVEKGIQSSLDEVKHQHKVLHDKKIALRAAISEAQGKSNPLQEKEQGIEKEEETIKDEIQHTKTLTDKQQLEKKRWNLEDERQRIEKERWDLDQQILEIQKKVNDISSQEVSFTEKETTLEGQLIKVKKQEIGLKAEADKSEVEKKFEDVKKQQIKLEGEWKGIMDKIKVLAVKETIIEDQKGTIQKEVQALEQEEHSATDPLKVHESETKRWKKDEELRALEQQEWKVGGDEAELRKSTDEIERKSQEVLHSERIMKERIKELEKLIKEAQQN